MKGINKMEFNTATMIEAVQLFLDSIMKVAPKVTAVEGGGQYQNFSVTVVTEEKPNGT